MISNALLFIFTYRYHSYQRQVRVKFTAECLLNHIRTRISSSRYIRKYTPFIPISRNVNIILEYLHQGSLNTPCSRLCVHRWNLYSCSNSRALHSPWICQLPRRKIGHADIFWKWCSSSNWQSKIQKWKRSCNSCMQRPWIRWRWSFERTLG